eukprot:403373835
MQLQLQFLNVLLQNDLLREFDDISKQIEEQFETSVMTENDSTKTKKPIKSRNNMLQNYQTQVASKNNEKDQLTTKQIPSKLAQKQPKPLYKHIQDQDTISQKTQQTNKTEKSKKSLSSSSHTEAQFQRLYDNFKIYESRRQQKIADLERQEKLKMQDKPTIAQKSEQMIQKKQNHLPIYSEQRIKEEKIQKDQLQIEQLLIKIQQQKLEEEQEIKQKQETPKIKAKKHIQNMEQRELKFKNKWRQNIESYEEVKYQECKFKPQINKERDTLSQTQQMNSSQGPRIMKLLEYANYKKEKQNKIKQDVQAQECTFKPQINKQPIQKSKQKQNNAYDQFKQLLMTENKQKTINQSDHMQQENFETQFKQQQQQPEFKELQTSNVQQICDEGFSNFLSQL